MGGNDTGLFGFTGYRTNASGKSNMSTVRSLETSATVEKSANRRHLGKEVGTSAPRFVFGVRCRIPAGCHVNSSHPPPLHDLTPSKLPGPGTYERVDPSAYKSPRAPKAVWGTRGVWADIDNREYANQRAKGYGRYSRRGGNRTSRGTDPATTTINAADAETDEGERQLLEKRKIPMRHPGMTVYNLPPLNHGPRSSFSPTPSAFANRIFQECLSPQRRYISSPAKYRLTDFPDPSQRLGYTRPSVEQQDTIRDSMTR